MARHVLVAGSLHYDLVIDTDRFPVADEYVQGRARRAPGGKAGNQALACARNGAPTSLIGRVGDDEAGNLLTANLARAGIDISQLQSGQGETTGSAVAIVNGYGDFGAVVMPGANLALDVSQVEIPANTCCLLLQNELPEETNLVLARLAVEAGARMILNGCPDRQISEDLLSLCDALVLGLHEAETMTGQHFSNSRVALEAMPPLAEKVPRILVLLGAGGMVHVERGRHPEYHATRERQPVSMLGVLDFFVGAFASQMAGGSEFEAAAHYAQAAATVFMTTPVERRDLIRATQIRARLGEDDQ